MTAYTVESLHDALAEALRITAPHDIRILGRFRKVDLRGSLGSASALARQEGKR
jgi:hypothetical protein